MGSYSEIVMSFPLVQSVDAEVLAAFASIAVAEPDAPTLPEPCREPFGAWELDREWCDMSDPWSHDWGVFLSPGTLRWHYDHWVVTTRTQWKASPRDFVGNLAVLGSIIDTRSAARYDDHLEVEVHAPGLLIGYTRFEYDPRPVLLWAKDGTVYSEDLNPPDHSG